LTYTSKQDLPKLQQHRHTATEHTEEAPQHQFASEITHTQLQKRLLADNERKTRAVDAAHPMEAAAVHACASILM